MHWLVALCVRYRGTVTVLTFLLLVIGVSSALKAPLDVFPDFVPSQVDIQTEAPGFTAEQVEQLVTKRIEDVINGAPGLATLRSQSIPGLSVITVNFQEGINLYNARQGISELLSEISTLPLDVGPPKLSPLVSSTMDLIKIGLTSDRLDDYDLRDAADWVIKPRLLAVPGVAHVIVFGGAVRQIQIHPDLAKLAAYSFTLTDLAEAARANLALRGAGYIDLKGQRVLLESPVPGPDPSTIGASVVAVRNNTPVLLRDVAQVMQAPALKFGDALIMGRPGILLSLASQYGANTLAVTLAVEAAMADLTPALNAQGITVYPALHRPANFIERALGNLEVSLAIAAALILTVLFAFLRDWRSALITFLAIPLSLLAAIAVLDRMGLTLNTMTLGGFAVALGVLVDDAIVGVENILRRLREDALAENRRDRLDVIREASLEVRGPVIYATLVVIAVFLPALFSSSVQGKFIGPLALAFILAVLASLLVAMTVTPALAALLLSAKDTHDEPRWIRLLKRGQARTIVAANRGLGAVLALVIMLFAGSLALLPFLGGTLMPEFREGHFVLQMSSSVPGTSLDEMLANGRRISTEILALPYIQSIEQEVGRAELSEDTWGPHQSEFHVELKPDAVIDQIEAQDQLRAILARYPGLQSEVVTFLGDRIGESLTGETAQVAIKVYGDDLEALDRVGTAIVQTLSNVSGVVDVQFARQSGTPALAIGLVPQALSATGLKAQDVLDAVQADYAGLTVGQTYVGTRSVDVVLLLSDALRHQPEQLSALMITGPFGPVPLSQVARVQPTEGRYAIDHEGGQRRIAVTFNVQGRSLQSTVGEARARLAASVVLPPGSYMEFTGAAEAERQTRNELLIYSSLALVVIVMILFVAFHWRAHPWLVMANLPFSLIGGIVAIWLTGVGLSLGALVGLVTVFGISARNAILLLAHYEHLVENENRRWIPETILLGANERLVPILMTAMVTALGLAPLAVGLNQPGQEIEGPMAITVLGGLLSSTLLNLLLLPALAERYSRPHG
jgi:CzcA family heavy metal efflux pump